MSDQRNGADQRASPDALLETLRREEKPEGRLCLEDTLDELAL